MNSSNNTDLRFKTILGTMDFGRPGPVAAPGYCWRGNFIAINSQQ